MEGTFTPDRILMIVSTAEIELRIGGKEDSKGALARFAINYFLLEGPILIMAGKSGVGFWCVFKAALVTISSCHWHSLQVLRPAAQASTPYPPL
jgi:hypothetical protein